MRKAKAKKQKKVAVAVGSSSYSLRVEKKITSQERQGSRKYIIAISVAFCLLPHREGGQT